MSGDVHWATAGDTQACSQWCHSIPRSVLTYVSPPVIYLVLNFLRCSVRILSYHCLHACMYVCVLCVERVLLGDNEGLYMLSLSDDGLYKFSDKDIRRVTQINVIKEENIIAILAGELCTALFWPCLPACRFTNCCLM